ncbi:MAG: hypothetical protein AUI14_19955 [Actinobacteria bacterium 13_2_20CM_2_71_6]|nr:MAG: hypothetical protein AUI14_19955 [Actinobacteria bacterium 13_2_20CM_2_71_6]
MRSAPPTWKLEGFLDCLDAWAESESPDDDLRLVVTAWVLTRYEDPYQGVRREGGHPNLWYGVVPYSGDGAASVVVCGYWIEESTRTVRCDSFAKLTLAG